MSKGMTLYLLRDGEGSRLHRLAGVKRATVVGWIDDREGRSSEIQELPPSMQIFEPTPDAPAVVFVVRRLGDPIVHVEPSPARFLTRPWYVADGAYACWSDSRVSEFVNQLYAHVFHGALAVHDRCED